MFGNSKCGEHEPHLHALLDAWVWSSASASSEDSIFSWGVVRTFGMDEGDDNDDDNDDAVAVVVVAMMTAVIMPMTAVMVRMVTSCKQMMLTKHTLSLLLD